MTEHKLSKIVQKITYRTTPWEKATGLMFKLYFEHEAYVFKFTYDKKIPIHMLFVFFPIDVLWVNMDNEIVDLKKSVFPFSPAVYHKGRASKLIELPKGTITKHKIALMDTIKE